MARLISVKQSILPIFILSLLSFVSDDVWGATEHEKRSLCPKDLSIMINNHPMAEEHPFFQQWQTMVRNFAPILHEGGRPSIFISHAWHMNSDGSPVDGIKSTNEGDVTVTFTTEEARYYDQIDLQLANILKSAGFDVHYDKDITNSQGIIDEGATPFMEKKVRESDVILGVCTPLYHLRSTRPSGVKIEVDRIKERLSESATVGFYIPLLVHESNKKFNASELLVGNDLERMKQVIYLDGRDKSTFISNMWRLFHRLWKPVKLKWENNPKYDPQTSPLNQRYIKALGDLLQIEDYYNHTGPISSEIKELLKNDYSNLRVLTTLSDDLKADVVAALMKKEIEAHQELLHSSKDQHIVAFLGNTGTGKSTLINFLAGKKLRADEHGQGYELVNSDDLTAMKVGSGADSETVYPQSIQVDDLLFFDLPGFNDTSGSPRDLVNSAFIRQILIEAASVRFVFVAGQDEITVHRSKIIKRLFDGLKTAFTSPTVIDNNSMLIVTKSAFQECSKAINFWIKKMRSAHGTELQDQLKAWHTNNRLFHMPYSVFNNTVEQYITIRESMLNGIKQMEPATPNDMQRFNISVFFPPEINMPLQNMFLYVIQEQCKKDIKKWEQLETFIDEYGTRTGVITENQHPKEAYFREVLDYCLENFWQIFWQGVNKELSPEMVLLRDICQDHYNQACHTFQSTYESRRQKYLQLPLQQMLVHVIEEQCKEDIKKWEQLEMFVDVSKLNIENIAKKKEYLRECNRYQSETFWSEFWKTINTQLSQEIGLLKDMYKDLYNQACHTVQRNHELKLKKGIQNYINILECDLRVQFLMQQGYDEALSWGISQLLVQQGHDEEESDRRIQLLLEHKGQFFDEIVFLRFLNGKLIYKPKNDSDEGMIEMKISDLANPLACEFDLSMCGDMGQRLSISTGYRKGKLPENKEKIEVWIVPKFVVEKELSTRRSGGIMPLLKKTDAEHYRGIMSEWSAPVAVFWSTGSARNNYFDYLTNSQFDDISYKNLGELFGAPGTRRRWLLGHEPTVRPVDIRHWIVLVCFLFIFN
jgi:hypothetical protein